MDAEVQERINSSTPEQLDAYLQEVEMWPFLHNFVDSWRVKQLLNKIVLGDYFGLKCILARTKLAPQRQRQLKFFKDIVFYEKEVKFGEFLRAVRDGRQCFLSEEADFYARALTAAQSHVIKRLAKLFTCMQTSKLAIIFGKTQQEVQELAQLGGHHIQDQWVKFKYPDQKKNSDKKKLVSDKQMELTELTTILTSFK